MAKDKTKDEAPKFGPVEARKQIRAMLAEGASVVNLPHAIKRMKERKIDTLMIRRCLEIGIVTEGPTMTPEGHYKVNVRRAGGPEPITCTVIIVPPDQLIIVTTFREN